MREELARLAHALEELVAELAAREEVDEEVEREVAIGEHLDNGERELILRELLVDVHADDDGRQKAQEEHIDRYEHERQVARARAELVVHADAGGRVGHLVDVVLRPRGRHLFVSRRRECRRRRVVTFLVVVAFSGTTAAELFRLLGHLEDDDDAAHEHDGERYERVQTHVHDLPQVLHELVVEGAVACLAHDHRRVRRVRAQLCFVSGGRKVAAAAAVDVDAGGGGGRVAAGDEHVATLEEEKVAGEDEVEYDERERDALGHARRAQVLGASQEHDRDDAIDGDHAEQQRGQVAQKVGQEDVRLAREHTKRAYVRVEVVVHDDAHQGHVEHGQIDRVEHGKVAERAEAAHLASQEHNDREDVGHRAQDEEADRKRRPDVVHRQPVRVGELVHVAAARLAAALTTTATATAALAIVEHRVARHMHGGAHVAAGHVASTALDAVRERVVVEPSGQATARWQRGGGGGGGGGGGAERRERRQVAQRSECERFVGGGDAALTAMH